MRLKQVHIILIVILLAISCVIWLSAEVFFPYSGGHKDPVDFNIKKGESLNTISLNLGNSGGVNGAGTA